MQQAGKKMPVKERSVTWRRVACPVKLENKRTERDERTERDDRSWQNQMYASLHSAKPRKDATPQLQSNGKYLTRTSKDTLEEKSRLEKSVGKGIEEQKALQTKGIQRIREATRVIEYWQHVERLRKIDQQIKRLETIGQKDLGNVDVALLSAHVQREAVQRALSTLPVQDATQADLTQAFETLRRPFFHMSPSPGGGGIVVVPDRVAASWMIDLPEGFDHESRPYDDGTGAYWELL